MRRRAAARVGRRSHLQACSWSNPARRFAISPNVRPRSHSACGAAGTSPITVPSTKVRTRIRTSPASAQSFPAIVCSTRGASCSDAPSPDSRHRARSTADCRSSSEGAVVVTLTTSLPPSAAFTTKFASSYPASRRGGSPHLIPNSSPRTRSTCAASMASAGRNAERQLYRERQRSAWGNIWRTAAVGSASHRQSPPHCPVPASALARP